MRGIEAPFRHHVAGRGRSGVPALLLAVAVAAAACSSGIDTAAAPGHISAAYAKLFNFSDKTVPGKIAVIQGGAALKSSLQDALASPLSNSATGAKVDSAKVVADATCTAAKVPTPCAQVKYDILGAGGSSLLGGQKGFAVYQSGKWLVAKVTICSLLGLFYSASGKSGAPPGC